MSGPSRHSVARHAPPHRNAGAPNVPQPQKFAKQPPNKYEGQLASYDEPEPRRASFPSGNC